MKTIFYLVFFALATAGTATAQEIHTLFGNPRPSGGYAALSNKFTTIAGQRANIAEVYGGWFAKKKVLIGLGAAATTNNLEVPYEFSTDIFRKMSWQYGQFGLMTEYVFWSNRVVHFNLTLFGGAGFTVQYERTDWSDSDHAQYFSEDINHDENFFAVVEPGAQLEVNIFKWMRLSPGISYRRTFESSGIGLTDSDLSDWSYNVSLKFGKF